MNLNFLKLRVANSPWLLFDARQGKLENNNDFWSKVAQTVCPADSGAFGAGIIILDRSTNPVTVKTWNSRGREVLPSPSALLSAARLLFDEGKASADSLSIISADRKLEVLVIDSATFGLPIGSPTSNLGETGLKKTGFKLTVLPENGVRALIELWGSTVDIVLYERPPKKALYSDKRLIKKAQVPGVEALLITRQLLRLRTRAVDPLISAAAALSVGLAGDYTDREIELTIGMDSLVVQWPSGGPIVAAARPEYCFSGEVWIEADEGSL